MLHLFYLGRYEVIAKVANAPGLVWALWTFHYEEHLPSGAILSLSYISTLYFEYTFLTITNRL